MFLGGIHGWCFCALPRIICFLFMIPKQAESLSGVLIAYTNVGIKSG
jgi:hypothetical protein